MLGFDGKQSNHKPDGWYFPDDLNAVAIVLETKSNDKDLLNKQWEDEILKNIRITQTKYKNVVGILYNGKDIRVFKNEEEIKDTAQELQHKTYYFKRGCRRLAVMIYCKNEDNTL